MRPSGIAAGHFSCGCPPGAFFSHATAAILFGIPLPAHLETDPRIHVTVLSPERAFRARGVVGHRAENLKRVCVLAGMPVLEPIATWCQLAAVLQRDDLIAAGDHLLRGDRALATGADIAAGVTQNSGQRGAGDYARPRR